jgi:hypothetical protein
MSRRIRAEVADAASAEVRLCAGADGRVQRVQVLRGSRSWAFHKGARARHLRLAIFRNSLLQRQSCGIAEVSDRVN